MSAAKATAASIIATLTLEDKIRLVSGRDIWNTEAVDHAGIESIMLTDGPHGLRKQNGESDHVGLANSVPATCFPPAATLGSTWDPALLEEVGAALGREARAENVGVLLGPGLNIKRHPAGGRTFEYLSEDPFVSGKLAAALVRGIQSQGVGACLKHYAVNNQESFRMGIDAIVDERTLREIYLTGFEIAVKESQPWCVMSSYNKINGEHAGESKRLLTDILRDEWGFDGLVMTDWFATYDRPAAISAGLDLEMPGSHGTWDPAIRKALHDGTLTEAELDRAVTRVVDLVLKTRSDDALPTVNVKAHHAIARKAAAAGTVLLTNDGTLPLASTGTIAVIGAFATRPRYQGNGSSLVNPTQLDTVLESLKAQVGDTATIIYAPGYDPMTGAATAAQIAEATKAAKNADTVVVIAGLPGRMESEGYDREHLQMPAGHVKLINAVIDANLSTTVVLMNGAPVEMPWASRPGAILEAYLGGQAGGAAIVDVLLGKVDPGGRLAESFPVKEEDIASSKNFPGHPTQVEYREGIYVGYRYFDASNRPARFAFGHGLSYTTFQYTDMRVTKNHDAGDDLSYTVTVTVTNTGKRSGSEVVQLYVRDIESSVHRPVKELKGFSKVHLDPGESAVVSIGLSRRSFAVYSESVEDWRVEAGDFEILLGSASDNIRVASTIAVTSLDHVWSCPQPLDLISDEEHFERVLGRSIPTPRSLLPFHYDSTVGQLRQTLLGRALHSVIMKTVAKRFAEDSMGDDGDRVLTAMLEAMPLRGVAMASDGGLTLRRLDTLICVLNTTSLKAWRYRVRTPKARPARH